MFSCGTKTVCLSSVWKCSQVQRRFQATRSELAILSADLLCAHVGFATNFRCLSTRWKREARQQGDALLTQTCSFAFTTLTQDKYFALITTVLEANAFQIRQQIAITCSVINHVAHVTLSFNDSNNFDLTNPVGLIDFPDLMQLSGLTAALF